MIENLESGELKLCRSRAGKVMETVTISKMKETEAYMWMEIHILNTLWNMAFEKVRFGRRDYCRN
jgi:hypothetical protein